MIYTGDNYFIVQMDCLDLMKHMEPETIDLIVTCYDDETEVLTNNGWKLFRYVENDDTIATLDKNGNIEYQTPLERTAVYYSGKMFSLSTPFVNVRVTPNHHLFVRRQRKNNFELIRADKTPLHVEYKTNGVWKGKTASFYIIPEYTNNVKFSTYGGKYQIERKFHKEPLKLPIKLFLEFFGYYLSEGHANKNTVRITNYDDEFIKRLSEIFDDMKINYSIYEKGKRKDFVVNHTQLATFLNKLGKATEKYIPRDILELNSDLLKILFEALMKGDGDKLENRKYWTSSEQLRDDFQELLLKIGFSGAYSISSQKGSKRVYKGKTIRSNETCWCIGVNREKLTPYIQPHLWNDDSDCFIGWKNYQGTVYCVSVPNRVIYVRRAGKPIWCGNSPPYNIGMEYDGYNDLKSKGHYSSWLLKCFAKMQRVLKPDGRLAVVISQSNVRGREPTAEHLCHILHHSLSMEYRNTIVWDKQTTSKRTAWGSWKSPSNPYFIDTTEFIYVFSNTERRHTSPEEADITREEFIHWTRTPWRIKPETRKIITSNNPAPFPLDIPVRLIKFLTYPKDVIFDPFMGSGTTIAAALLLNRYAMGCDISRPDVDFTHERITKTKYIRSDVKELKRILSV